ncbi:hypothetical protein [Pedobacter agri]|uniref:hypothetical protein n=1 Tax=Pedobacter agri TaxID=454586 RepID=UPI00292EBF88|nr:hypothetical protein [Pedobacter agri]
MGDIQEAQLRPLLEKYFGSLQAKNKQENFRDNSAEWISGKVDKDIYLAMENPKSTVNVGYK